MFLHICSSWAEMHPRQRKTPKNLNYVLHKKDQYGPQCFSPVLTLLKSGSIILGPLKNKALEQKLMCSKG